MPTWDEKIASDNSDTDDQIRRLRYALENCYLLALGKRVTTFQYPDGFPAVPAIPIGPKSDDADWDHIKRFCEDAGLRPTVLRVVNIPELIESGGKLPPHRYQPICGMLSECQFPGCGLNGYAIVHRDDLRPPDDSDQRMEIDHRMEVAIGETVSRQWLRIRAGKFYSNRMGDFCDLPTHTFKMVPNSGNPQAGTDMWERIE